MPLFSRRVNILLAVFLLAWAAVMARLAQVQIGWHHTFEPEAYARAGGDRVLETVRGGIYTRWGEPLAVEVPSFDLGVLYDRLPEQQWRGRVAALCGASPEELALQAEAIIRRVERIQRSVQQRSGLDPAENYIRVAEQDAYHPVVRNISPEVAVALRAELAAFVPTRGRRQPDLCVLECTRRVYPNGDLAPHIVGQLGPISPELWARLESAGLTWSMAMPVTQAGARYQMNDLVGLTGVEAAQESLLRGRRGSVTNRWEFKALRKEKKSTAVPPVPGADVFLTIHADFQRAANAALVRAAQTPSMDFHSGALVIIDVRDGAILAASTYPSYDLSTHGQDIARLNADPRAPLIFRPLSAALPTGSVFKVITAIAALQTGAIEPSTVFTCEGADVFAGRRFRCTGVHGSLSLLPAIEHSCNVYFYNAGLRAGPKALAEWGRLFGLGVTTGVDLPVGRSGRLTEPRSVHETVNLSIGQGALEVTPLQVANMMAAIANGGRLYRPHFFHHARGPDGMIVKTYEPAYVEVPVSPAALSAVREGLCMAVDTGTASRAGLGPFRAAGKTGTAEVTATLNHAWFAGYAPRERPKIAFALVSERTAGYGGSHAAAIMAWALEQIWDEVEAMP